MTGTPTVNSAGENRVFFPHFRNDPLRWPKYEAVIRNCKSTDRSLLPTIQIPKPLDFADPVLKVSLVYANWSR
jgi:hypothetical protein